MKYYRNKFGFEIIEQRQAYNDDDDDDDDDKLYYYMRLDLSKLSGGKMKKKRILFTRKRRKLRKI